jgi:hypothetical protein
MRSGELANMCGSGRVSLNTEASISGNGSGADVEAAQEQRRRALLLEILAAEMALRQLAKVYFSLSLTLESLALTSSQQRKLP